MAALLLRVAQLQIYIILLLFIGPITPINIPNDIICNTHYSNYKTWDIEANTDSFLNEDDNFFWIKTSESSTSQLLFTEDSTYKFDLSYDYESFTININGDFNVDTDYGITEINPLFFIYNNDNYIGISFGI